MRILIATDQSYPDLMGGVARVATPTLPLGSSRPRRDGDRARARRPPRPVRCSRTVRSCSCGCCREGACPRRSWTARRPGAGRPASPPTASTSPSHTRRRPPTVSSSRSWRRRSYTSSIRTRRERASTCGACSGRAGSGRPRSPSSGCCGGSTARRSAAPPRSSSSAGSVARFSPTSRRWRPCAPSRSTALWTPRSSALRDARRRGGGSASRTTRGSCSPFRRLVPRMGIENLLEAAAALRDLDGLQLAIAGGGSLEGELRSRAKALNLGAAVRFLGRVPDEELPLWHRAADLFVLPTTAYEGLGSPRSRRLRRERRPSGLRSAPRRSCCSRSSRGS